MEGTVRGDDGRLRCSWGAEPRIYRDYHDTEWGFPVTDDRRLFEKLSLEGFQAGLSWLTILRKRPAFRTAFGDFDPVVVAGYGERDVERLLADPGIVRHERKIRSVINNAARALELMEERGSLSSYFWEYANGRSEPPGQVPSVTPTSTLVAADLKRRGWAFVGPTTVYAFMQAMGLVNDHVADCWVRAPAERLRSEAMAAR